MNSSLPQVGSSFPNLSLLRKTACARHQPGPCATSGSFPLILGTLLFCCGLGGLAALWVLSRLHPVRLVDWDGSLHTGLEGYLMATGLWPVLLLACILLGCGSLTLLYLWGTRRKNS